MRRVIYLPFASVGKRQGKQVILQANDPQRLQTLRYWKHTSFIQCGSTGKTREKADTLCALPLAFSVFWPF